MPRVCLFDVNETLLDLSGLDREFQRVFGKPGMREQWFHQLLQSALVTTITGPYVDFTSIAGAALKMTATRQQVNVLPPDEQRLLAGMRHLQPFPDVPGGLARLRSAGLRLFALTNGTLDSAKAQLANAGIADMFEDILSADTAKRLKPAPEPYRFAAKHAGVETSDCWMVAAHAWDIAGAMRAGCNGALVTRPGKVPDPLAPEPQVMSINLEAVAEQILTLEGLSGS